MRPNENILDVFSLEPSMKSRLESRTNLKDHLWNLRPLHWLLFFRWSYLVGLLPLKVTVVRNSVVLTRCKLRQGLQLVILLICTTFLAFTFRNAFDCNSYVTPAIRLLVHFGDIAKCTSLTYVLWFKHEAIERVLNSALCQQTLTAEPSGGDRTKMSVLRKAWIWTVVLGYPLHAYFMFTTIDIRSLGFVGGDSFSQVCDPFINCSSNSTLLTADAEDRHRWTLGNVFDILWRVAFSLHMGYLLLSDTFFLATVGAYGEFVDEILSKLEEESGMTAADQKSQDQSFQHFEKLQSIIRNMNEGGGAVIAACFFADLPFHVARGIPDFMANSPSYTRAYTIQFYFTLAFAAVKSSQLTNFIRSWISKLKRNAVQHQPELQLLYMDANSCQDFALNLYGLGCLNSTLFLSTISVTVTYTILNYQLSLYNKA